MGRKPCCAKDASMKRGAWTPTEDKILTEFIQIHGEGKWRSLPERAGLKRCGKSCRLRWMNYLRPDIKRGSITDQEEDLIIRLHKLLGNRWSLIAGRLPGRTDNEIKNYWHTKLMKKIKPQSGSKLESLKNRNLTKKQNLYLPQPRRHGGVKTSAVQPKATRCAKPDVMIPSPAESEGDQKLYDQFDQTSSTGSPTTTTEIETSPINVEGNEQFDDFMIDFEMDHHLLSDFLNTDWFEPSNSENYGVDYQSSSEGNAYDREHNSASSKSDETFLFLSEETPALGSDFGSVDFPIEIDHLDNWLQV